MSVLVSKRGESKLDVIAKAEELHDMMIRLMQHNFGLFKSGGFENFVRTEYAYGKLQVEDFKYYGWQLMERKKDVDKHSTIICNDLRAANTGGRPTTKKSYETRRELQTDAIRNCELLVNDLQRICRMFNVDVNIFSEPVKAINQEENLIRKWRQSDNSYKFLIQGDI